jgi:sugar (pentulose or hexulose) kinase
LDYQFLQVVRGLECGLGVQPETIVAIGGAIHNRFWMQNKADVVGKPIEVPEIEEAVVLGAALLAGTGVGVYRDVADAYAQVHRPGRVYEPDLVLNARYREWFAAFESLYPALKAPHAGLRGAC